MLVQATPIPILLTIVWSFQTGTPTDEWFVVSPPGVEASVEMPTIPKFKQETIRPVRGRPEIMVRSRISAINNGNTSLTFVYYDEPDPPVSRTKINKILNGAMTGAIALVNGEIVTQQEIYVGNSKGLDFVYTCEVSDAKLQQVHQLRIRTQLIMVGRRLFSLNYISVVGDYDDSVAERFFNSFELVTKPDDLPPRPRAGRARELANEKRDPAVPEAKPAEPIQPDPVPPENSTSEDENSETEAAEGREPNESEAAETDKGSGGTAFSQGT